MRLELRFLGGLSIHQDGAPLTALKSQKGQALLCYLALTGKAHARPVLAGLLWPEMPEANALLNLRNVLNQLNRHLAPYLVITRQSIAFNQDALSWLDVTEFEAGVAAKSDIGRLQAAVTLYQGDFLDGFYVPDAPQFDEWVLAQRARLREMALSALHRLVTHVAAQTEYETAITYTRQLLGIEPWWEEAHRELMRLLALSGQRSAALMQYETCRRILAEELAVEPSAETQVLYQAIRTGQLSQGAAVAEEPGIVARPSPLHPLPPAPRHNLPTQPTPFIGREEELTVLGKLIGDPATRLITIVGPGGIGKTRLALAAAERQLEATLATTNGEAVCFPNGVYFVSLAPLTSAEQMIPTIAVALSFSFYEGRELQEQLLDYLRQKRMMLIMDNFEHLLPEGGDLLTNIFRQAPTTYILVTSRERLHLQEEQVFLLQGLAFPAWELPPSAVADATEYAAVKLFYQSACRLQANFELTTSDLSIVARICRMVEGMPLAIELAAGWVDTLSLADIAAELQQGLDFLETDVRNVPERHRNMRAVFDVTWHQLNQVEQEVFAQLSVFRDGFTRQAAQAVTALPASLRLLAALVSKSLLQYDRTRDRYQLHELLRQYGADKLAQDSLNEAAACDRHATYYCLALQQWEANLKGIRQQTALAEIETDMKNIQLAWEWAVTRRQLAQLDQAREALFLFYEWRGRFQEGKAACQSAASVLTNEKWTAPVFQAPTPSGNTQRLLAWLLTWQSIFSRTLGRTVLASQLLHQSLTLLDSPPLADHDTRLERAFAWQQMGKIAYDRANYEEARRLYAQSLKLYRALDDQWGTADVLLKSGNAAADASAYEEAKQLVAESLTLFQALGDPRGMSTALLLLGEIARYSGVYNEAKQLFAQNLDLSQAQGNLWGIANSLVLLGELALFQGEFEAGVQLLQGAVAISREMGDRERLATSLATLASAYCFCGEFAQACAAAEEGVMIGQDQKVSTYALFSATIALTEANTHAGRYEEVYIQAERALTLARKAGIKYCIGWAHKWLGWVALAEEKYGEAHHCFQEELANYLASWHAEWRAWALAGLGRAAYGLGNQPEAQRHLVQALRAAVEIQAFIPLLFLLPLISLLLADEANGSQQERAMEVYALATSHPFVVKSRLFADITGRHMAAVAATLPPEAVEAAQSRGRALEWWATAAELLEALQKLGWHAP